MEKVTKTKDHYLTSQNSLEKDIKFEKSLNFKELEKNVGELFDLELLSDYKLFSKNVLYNMDVHEEEDKNFII